MTKQEYIEQEYGSHWETIKDYVDENGWCNAFFIHKTYFQTESTSEKWRPIALKAIENNNGWIAIKDKRPEIGDKIISYRVFTERTVEEIETVTREFLTWYDMNNITHWKYYESKPPIY